MNARMDAFLEDYTAKKQFSGVVRITKQDKIIYERYCGLADKEHSIPFCRNSLFSLYSISKAFCSIGLMLLVDKGLVDLDAHPGVYVPEAKDCHPALTVRHLLHHTSGLPDFLLTDGFKEQYAPGTADKIREHLRIISHYPVHFLPGEQAEYCNINFNICALIIENISGLPYAQYMAKEVFTPLGARTAFVDGDTPPAAQRVQGYSLIDGTVTPVNRSPDWMFGAGDCVGSADDVYCLNTAIKHRLVLSEESWQKVLDPCPLNNKGMGCTITTWHGKRKITHNGGHKGFRTLHVQLPADDFDVIILSNSGWGESRKEILEMIHEIYYGHNDLPTQDVEMDKGYI